MNSSSRCRRGYLADHHAGRASVAKRERTALRSGQARSGAKACANRLAFCCLDGEPVSACDHKSGTRGPASPRAGRSSGHARLTLEYHVTNCAADDMKHVMFGMTFALFRSGQGRRTAAVAEASRVDGRCGGCDRSAHVRPHADTGFDMKLRMRHGTRPGNDSAVVWVAGVVGLAVLILCVSGAIRRPRAPASITTIEAIGRSAEMQGQMYRPLWAAFANFFAARPR